MQQNSSQNRIATLVVALIVAAAAILGAAALFSISSTNTGATAASSTVILFGQHLSDVSLLAPDAASTIQMVYGRYVTSDLLKSWQSNPQSAPGKTASSPWPDHIVIDSITPQGQSYIVNGKIILMTSDTALHGGTAGAIPVVIQLVKQNGRWLIAAYQEQRV